MPDFDGIARAANRRHSRVPFCSSLAKRYHALHMGLIRRIRISQLPENA